MSLSVRERVHLRRKEPSAMHASRTRMKDDDASVDLNGTSDESKIAIESDCRGHAKGERSVMLSPPFQRMTLNVTCSIVLTAI